jgi:hypothetical protein
MFESLPPVDWSPGAGVVWLATGAAIFAFAAIMLWANERKS